MMSIRTVLCPVDFSPATTCQVALAADLCRAFGARLVLHHNIIELPLGIGAGWMWAADHPPESERDAVDRLETLRNGAPDVPSEAVITRGSAAESIVATGDDVHADLVILNARPGGGHAAIAEQTLDRENRAVLALHESGTATPGRPFRLTAETRPLVVVPTDLSRQARAAVAFAMDLARVLPVRVHLLRILPGDPFPHAGDVATDTQALQETEALIPGDIAGRVVADLERRPDRVEGIADAATRLSAACIVMGEHTRASHGVLREAPCPVWYVPARRATA